MDVLRSIGRVAASRDDMILIRRRPLNAFGLYALSNRFDAKFNEQARGIPGLSYQKKSSHERHGYLDSIGVLENRLKQSHVGKIVGPNPQPPRGPWTNLPKDLDNDNGFKLRAYQKVGAQFTADHAHEGVIVADAVGLGKTCEILYAIKHRLALPAVVVCPAIVKNEWVKDGAKLGIDVLSLSSVTPPDNAVITEEDGILVINYDIIYAWLDVLRGAKTVVFDEGHALTNSKSRRSGVCREIARAADNRIVSSATPYTSRPIQLWNVVDTISPGRFGSYYQFGKVYCGGFQEEIPDRNAEGGKRKVWNFKGASKTEELNLRLNQFMVRRTKEEVHLELPPMTRQTIEIEVANDSELSLNSVPQEIDKEWMRWALSISARGKIGQAVELAKMHLENGSSVVVAAFRHEVARELRDAFAEAGIDVFVATGEQSVAARRKAIDEASRNTPCIIVVTTHSVGEGINTLTFADVAIIVELDYVPRWIIQFEGRLCRQGQNRNVLFQYLIGLSTMDEIIRDRVLERLRTFETTVGSMGDGLASDLAGEDLSEDALLADLRETLRRMA